MFDKALIEAAHKACENSHAPYSKASRGAAVLDSDGRIYSGCTVELANYSGTVHAEQVAIASAIASGAKKLVRLALYPADYPCGICRQFMREFNPEFVVVYQQDGEIRTVTMDELYPNVFGRENLQLPPTL